jgi:hypothetical protein
MTNFEFQLDEKTFQLGMFGFFLYSQNATDQPGAFSFSVRLPLVGLLVLSHDYKFGWEFERLPALVMRELDAAESVVARCSEGETLDGSIEHKEQDLTEALRRIGVVPLTQARLNRLRELTEGVEVDLDDLLEDEPLEDDED